MGDAETPAGEDIRDDSAKGPAEPRDLTESAPNGGGPEGLAGGMGVSSDPPDAASD